MATTSMKGLGISNISNMLETNLQKNFQVLMTVNYRDTAKSVILIYMTVKMMHYYLMLQMTTWLTTMLCERTWAIMSDKKNVCWNKWTPKKKGCNSRYILKSFDKDIVYEIVNENNHYAQDFKNSRGKFLPKHLRVNELQPLISEEIYIVLAIFILTCIHTLYRSSI